MSSGSVTVQSNAVAGGTTWRWYWNGTQFLNHGDYGREIQGAFEFGTSLVLNPTEAGDFMTMGILDPSLRHGSPLLRFENQGNTQYTRAIPLQWDPTQYGGDQDHPVIWDSLVLGKDLTLNFQNLGPVATAWSAVYGNGTDVVFPAGETTYNVYLITETLQNVTARMDDLFQTGVR